MFLLPFIFGFADRFSGGGFGWETLKTKIKIPGRGIHYVTMALLAYAYFLAPALLIPFVSWCIYRNFPGGWKVFGGKIDPKTPKELVGTFASHLIPSNIIFIASLINHTSNILAAEMVIYPILATVLGWMYAHNKIKNYAVVETVRGFIFGLILFLGL